jgi:vancomycin permeability regulator SanA
MAAAVPGSSWRALKIAGALVALTVAGVAGPNAWAAIAAHGRTYSDLASVPSRTVAIVPGIDVWYGKPSSQLRGRLETALELYRQRQVQTILVSGNNTSASPEVSAMRAWLLANGVPSADIVVDSGGFRTRETMRRAAGVYGVTDAIVCTQDLYMPRTLFLAQQSGIDAVGAIAPNTGRITARRSGKEALKTTLAFVESYFGSKQLPETRALVAAR